MRNRTLRELADVMESRRVPGILASAAARSRIERETSSPVATATARTTDKLRADVGKALRYEFRAAMSREAGAPDFMLGKGARAKTAVLNQLAKSVDAALVAADPQAYPKLVGDAIRRHVAPDPRR